MTSFLRSIALSRLEQAFLYATNSMKVVAPPLEWEKPGAGRPKGRKNENYGKIRDLALEWLEGKFEGKTMIEVSIAHKISPESFRFAVWTARRKREAA